MVLKLILLFSFLCSVAWAGLPPTSTQGSGDATFSATFKFAFPNTDITHTGSLATLGKTYVPGGGTGQSSFTANALLVGNGASPLLSLASGSSGQVIHSNGASLPTWAAVSLSQDVTGTLGVTNGGTGLPSLTSPAALVVNASNAVSQASGATANKLLRTDGSSISFASANVSTDVTGIENVVNGGTGKATLTANALLLGNGTNPINSLSGLVSGDVAKYNGTTWTSAAASANFAITTKSANYTATSADDTIVFTTSATLSLPAAASNIGKIFNVVASGTSTVVTIDPNSTETVCGSLTIKASGDKDSVSIQSDGTNWVGVQGACYRNVIAIINCSGSSSVTSAYGAWISALGNVSTGTCAITVASGLFSANPICTITSAANYAGFLVSYELISNSATSLTFGCRTITSGSATVNNCGSIDAHIECGGPR